MSALSAIKTAMSICIFWCLLFPKIGVCQGNLEKVLSKKMDSLLAPTEIQYRLTPNDAAQTITIPSGFGGYGTYIFGDIAGVYKQVYKANADLIASAGFCIGDPAKSVNFAAGFNMTDVHRLRDFSANFIVSRIIFKGTSISAGGLQLFADKGVSDAPGSTFYIAVSHAVQTIASETEGASKLTYTIGIGNGRFYNKSFFDIAAGRGKHGTAVFAGISYEVVQHVNLNAEWSAMNLGLTVGIRPLKNPLSLGIGVTNLTRYSADKPNMVFTLGYPLSLSRQIE